ncbi:Ribonuclease H-like superfamily [Sesbania bispinosa]|nr:Ribonuclease H-like superfamily [Sesbania bispinosa]
MQKAAEDLKEGLVTRLGEGNSNFLFDSWLPTGPISEAIDFINSYDLNIRIKDVYDGHNWNLDALWTRIPPHISHQISAINSPIVPGSPELQWSVFNLHQEFRTVFGEAKADSDQIRSWIKWIAPPQDWVAVHVDGSYNSSTLAAGIGGVIRDSSGAWLKGFMGSINANDSLEAELCAILHGLKIAWVEGYKNIILWKGNQCADALAKKGVTIENPSFVILDSPGSFNELVIDDSRGTLFPRGSG